MENLSRSLKLPELWRLKWAFGCASALLGVSSAFYVDAHSWPLAAAAAVALVTVGCLPRLSGRLPGAWWRLGFPFLVLYLAADLVISGQPVLSLLRLTVLLTLYRGVTYRNRREDLQLLTLSLFLVVSAGVLTSSIWFAGQLVLFAASALGLLFLVTLAENARAGGARETGWAELTWKQVQARVRQSVDWRMGLFAGALFATVLTLTALLFLALPRVQLERAFSLAGLLKSKTTTGFNDSIQFGEITDIQNDTGVAMRVEVSPGAALPAEPYWRMVVLDEYTGSGFRQSRSVQLEMNSDFRDSGAQIDGEGGASNSAETWTFYLEPGISRYLPLPTEFALLRFSGKQETQRSRWLQVLALRREPPALLAYRVEGARALERVTDPFFSTLLRGAREGKTIDPRTASSQWRRERGDLTVVYPLTTISTPAGEGATTLERLAREVTGQRRLSATAFAQAACRWLQSRHGYSMRSQLPTGSGDPVVRWLDSTTPGHCELFSAGFALLGRAAGFPTRVVAGFRGGSWNAFQNYFMVRHSHAHAWCEIYDVDSGSWLRVDPTAGTVAAAGSDAGAAAVASRETWSAGREIDGTWKAYADSLRLVWYRRVVDFDGDTQTALAGKAKGALGEGVRHLYGAFLDAGTGIKTWLTSPWDLGRLALLLPVLSTLGLLVVGIRFLRRHLANRGGEKAVRLQAGRWLRDVRGLPAGKTAADPGGESRQLVEELERLRFGPPTPPAKASVVFRRARRLVRR